MDLGPQRPSPGRPLSELDLLGRPGVTVAALLREGCTPLPLHPSPELREGDLLALAGSEHALDEAEHLMGERVLLTGVGAYLLNLVHPNEHGR